MVSPYTSGEVADGTLLWWRGKTDLLLLRLSPPLEKHYNQIICVISGSTCDVGSAHQSKELSHARIILSEWFICDTDAVASVRL